MTNRIYRYVVRYDTGAAPNPFGGCCTLAICKPAIRKTAQVGDWIVGLRSGRPDHVIYVMQVARSISFETFWEEPIFSGKKPDACTSSDNIYMPSSINGLVQVPNRVHKQNDTTRDLSGQRVLVGSRYWYFGMNSPKLPPELHHLIHRSQGHSVDKNRRNSDLRLLEGWLSQWQNGIYGAPIDAHRLLSTIPTNLGTRATVMLGSSLSAAPIAQPRMRSTCG